MATCESLIYHTGFGGYTWQRGPTDNPMRTIVEAFTAIDGAWQGHPLSTEIDETFAGMWAHGSGTYRSVLVAVVHSGIFAWLRRTGATQRAYRRAESVLALIGSGLAKLGPQGLEPLDFWSLNTLLCMGRYYGYCLSHPDWSPTVLVDAYKRRAAADAHR